MLTTQISDRSVPKDCISDRFRVIIVAWGDEYVDKLVKLTLPALLAPGNLPALASRGACEVVLMTQRDKFAGLSSHPIFGAVSKHAQVSLRALDDLLEESHYGYLLTQAFWRGFADLGVSARDVNLLFLNVDFILAEDCYLGVLEALDNGERLIHAPSYCAIEEEVRPILESRLDSLGTTLAIRHRDLARLLLDHPHTTVRAKTLNQRAWSLDRTEQFYHRIGDSGMVGRQLPPAIVCLRPTALPDRANTFWDYGIPSELCPGIEPTVLGDTDTFMMLELRATRTYRDQAKLGWPTEEEIADDLASFATFDQIRFAKFPLLLRAEEMNQSDIDACERILDAFVSRVESLLPSPPRSHIDHPFWTRLNSVRSVAVSVDPKRPAHGRGLSARFAGFLRDGYLRVFGKAPYLTPRHLAWPYYYKAVETITKTVASRKPRSAILIKTVPFDTMFQTLLDDLEVQDIRVLERDALDRIRQSQGPTEAEHGARDDDGNRVDDTSAADLVVFSIGYSDLIDFAAIYDRSLRNLMRPEADLIVHFANTEDYRMNDRNPLFIDAVFQMEDSVTAFYCGADVALIDAAHRNRFYDRLFGGLNSPSAIPGAMVALARSLWIASIQNKKVANHKGNRFPACLTAITLKIRRTRLKHDAY